MRLTPVEQREVARKAHILLDVDLGRFGNDTFIMAGDGVDDLDRMIEMAISLKERPKSKLVIDLGSMYSVYKPCDEEDLMAIRAWYVHFYGEVAKPDEYREERSLAIELPDEPPATQPPVPPPVIALP